VPNKTFRNTATEKLFNITVHYYRQTFVYSVCCWT